MIPAPGAVLSDSIEFETITSTVAADIARSRALARLITGASHAPHRVYVFPRSSRSHQVGFRTRASHLRMMHEGS
jgi:hypothetical protein